MDEREVDRAVDELAELAAAAYGRPVRLCVSVVGARAVVDVYGPERELMSSSARDAAAALCERAIELRGAMAQPGRGSWWAVTIDVRRRGPAGVVFDFQGPPRPEGAWRMTEVAADLVCLGIDPVIRPAWARGLLAESASA